jgi:ATP-dependent DNA helicase RecG
MMYAAPHDRLDTPAQFVKGVGPQRAEKLLRLGIHTARDLLFYVPRDYKDLTDLRRIADVEFGKLQTVCGRVVDLDARRAQSGKTISAVLLDDGSGRLVGVWFNQPRILKRFHMDETVLFSGKPTLYEGRWQMQHPEVQQIDAAAPEPYMPVYGLTEDLRPGEIRRILRGVVQEYAGLVPDRLPAALRQRLGLPDIATALAHVHFPPDREACRLARQRLAYEELLLLQLAMALRHRDFHDRREAPRFEVSRRLDERIRRLFPFQFTAGQDHAVGEIVADLASGKPMCRLLQGDVGVGKTAVACYALLVAVAQQHQAALMAPTEILARQHWQTLDRYLADSRVRRKLLVGSLSAREREETLAAVRAGEVDLVVGTHAVIQEDVEFARLGLVVIDEQHKFGVQQRARFRHKGLDPHYLVMTATPIPRTLTMTVFGDLDLTTIRDQPPGRQPVRTYLVKSADRTRSFDFVCRKLKEGRQAYVICPLVADSETLDLRSAERTAAELGKGEFAGFTVGLVHGRLSDVEKEAAMRRFREGRTHVLVSTIVVEVGVDVPNATLMMVLDAERFGLSQLHQLRGRIARGSYPGYCFLFASPRTADASERLEAVASTSDGFRIAEEDLRIRGPGEFLGTRQHGLPELRVADLIRDVELISEARRDAIAIVLADPELQLPEHQPLKQAMLDRFGEALELAQIA